MHDLTWDHVRAFLPVMDAAEERLSHALQNALSDAGVNRAFADYYEVVELGILAFFEDTKDRNSLSTLQSVFRKKWYFGDILRRFMEGKQ